MVSSDGTSALVLPASVFYSFTLIRHDGTRVNFLQFANKVVVVVNVASLCGFTPQYHELEQLYRKYREKGLVILAFPCNQFGGQEPFEDAQIEAYARKHFEISFPIMKKLRVNGDGESKLYTWLKDQKQGDMGFRGVRWNFEKFIIDRTGKVVARYSSAITPLAFEDELVRLLEV